MLARSGLMNFNHQQIMENNQLAALQGTSIEQFRLQKSDNKKRELDQIFKGKHLSNGWVTQMRSWQFLSTNMKMTPICQHDSGIQLIKMTDYQVR